MDYEYDAFFSYKRDVESNAWHERVKEKLTYWLKLELPKPDVRIFFDSVDIRSGTIWRERLADALRRSRCVVCIWSPLYFQSQWCLSEWMTFVERGRRAKRQLVMPASYFDGQNFPEPARAVQFLDFSEFASTMPRFWDTEAAVQFEKLHLRPFATNLANMIRAAPPFDDTFDIVEASAHLTTPEADIARIADV